MSGSFSANYRAQAVGEEIQLLGQSEVTGELVRVKSPMLRKVG